ncbi:hypothetical protein [Porphyromonas endodontalis]
MAKGIQSVEPNIADFVNGWLKSYKLDYKLEQESLNAEIDKALTEFFTKNGGSGANRPDAKLLLQDKQKDKILLPCFHGQEDFSKMGAFISGIQKLVIKDVVFYADREIEATKQVVSRTSNI